MIIIDATNIKPVMEVLGRSRDYPTYNKSSYQYSPHILYSPHTLYPPGRNAGIYPTIMEVTNV